MNATFIHIPMDETQNHLKAYGIAYYALHGVDDTMVA